MKKISTDFFKFFSEHKMDGIKDTVLACSGLIIGVLVVLLLVLIGWFIVWKMFLVRFPLVRELVYGSSDEKKPNATMESSKPLRNSVRLHEKSKND